MENTKGNTITITSDIVIENDLSIDNGSLILNGNHLNVAYNMDVYGFFLMNTMGATLTVGADYTDALRFYSGSTGILDDGTTNIYGWIRTDAGCSFNATTTNTIYFKGATGGGPWNNEPSAVYGHMIVDKNPGARTYVALSATQPHVLLGDLTVQPDNEFELQNNTVNVNGFLTDDASSEIYVWETSKDGGSKSSNIPDEAKGKGFSGDLSSTTGVNESGSKGGYFEIDNDFILNGLMDVADGDVLLHGNFGIAATGILDITTGSVIADQAYADSKAWQYLHGTINLTNGLFEISHNSIWFSSTSVNNISGGIMRCGFSFSAFDAGTFQPSSGIVEFIGTGYDPRIEMDPSNYFNDIVIDRSESIYLATDIYVQNDLEISSGQLFAYDYALLPHNIYLGGDWTNNVGTVI